MRWKRKVCVVTAAVLWGIFAGQTLADTEEQLPADQTGTYAFYLSENTPYVRLSPHRCETMDADGDRQPRRIAAVYALADLRQFGGENWSAKENGFSAAYSGLPTATVRSGTRYRMLSPEQAGMEPETAARLRTIAANAYPFCSAEQMQTRLLNAGILIEKDGVLTARENEKILEGVKTISESELLSAVQTAIWKTAGKDGSLRQVYSQTDAVGRTERTLYPDPYGAEAAVYPYIGNNIRAVSSYLTSMDGSSEKADMPITAMTVFAERDAESGKSILYIRPNGTVNADDRLVLTVGSKSYALLNENGEHSVLLPDADGVWSLELPDIQEKESVSVRLQGVQQTERDLCLYLPQDGDVSACLVGLFGGKVEVDLRDTLSSEQMTHRVRLRCVTELYRGGSSMPLADAVFSLYLLDASHGMICAAEGLRTNADGLIDITGLRVPKDGEHYVFVQTASPAGYLPSESPKIYADAAAAVRVENAPAYTAAAELILTDDDGAGLKDITFRLCRMFGAETKPIGTYQTDASGHILVQDLPAGYYCFYQERIPNGYMAENQTVRFEIKADGGNVQVSARNFAYRSMEGTVRFEACDPPAGVLVKLLRNGAVCAEQAVSEETDWQYCFSEIPVLGSYSVEQESIAGYLAKCDEKGIVNSIRRRDVVIRQHMEGDGSLRGTVFSLHSAEDGHHVCTASSDAAGNITFPDLTVGSYVLRERRAPRGVCAMEEPLCLAVSDPNRSAHDDRPLSVRLETEDGVEIRGLCLDRQRKRVHISWMHALVCFFAVCVMTSGAFLGKRLHVRRVRTSCIYSGRTRLYPMVKKAPGYIRHLLRKH